MFVSDSDNAPHLLKLKSRSDRPISLPRAFRAMPIGAAVLLALLAVGVPATASMRPHEGGALQPGSTTATIGAPRDQVIWQADRGEFAAQPANGPALIHLGAGYDIDPSQGDPTSNLPPELRGTPPSGDERGYFLVQLHGPVRQDDRDAIEETGARIIGYVPDYAFLVSATSGMITTLSASSHVAWAGLYQPAFKISQLPKMKEAGVRTLAILVFPDADLTAAKDEMARAGAAIVQTSDNGINKIVHVDFDPSGVARLAQIKGIAWIEPYERPQLYNNQCQWVVQDNTNNVRHIWDVGLRGEGQIVSIADTGIRTTHNQFKDINVPINDFGDYPTHRKIIAYKRTVEINQITFGDDGGNSYHGTHTSCTMAGDDQPNAGDARDGMAIHSKIYFLDGGSAFAAGVYVPPDLNDLMIIPYNGNSAGGSRIMSNSWGVDNYGAYDLSAMTADQFMWYHPDFLACIANGNVGSPGSVGSPATAKNVISAGGTGNGTTANQLASFTSRGPTQDGRYKPTICAPAILSSANGAGDTGYWTLQGTSMATPAIAGATALIRQYLTEGWYPTGSAVPGNAIASPSAALMKALAINSADNDIGGFTVPDNNVGWGRIDLDQGLYISGDTKRLALVDGRDALMTGDYVEYKVYVASNSVPLKASLVWTDYPGSPNASIELVNDLNLTATDGTNTYKGNVYSAGQSATGGNADARNVEENVRRNIPTVGLWTFRVEGANVPFGPQPFALVITGALASDQGLLTLSKATYGGFDTMGIHLVDTNAGGTVSVTVASNTETTPETVVMTGSNGIYDGSIPVRPSNVIQNNGELSVSDGDQITVTYTDANPAGVLTATARVDITSPIVTNVHATSIDETRSSILWTTSAAATSRVYYGTTPALGNVTDGSPNLIVNHAVELTNLSPDQAYYYDVESIDNQGNTTRDDNGGNHYTFTTDLNRDVLLSIGDDTFTANQTYLDAFTRTGWSYTLWEGNESAVPMVGNLTAGMASYKAVLWQTGYEQYPMFTDAAVDSITYLNSLGMRFAFFSHDVGWDFCNSGSQDYSLARCQFVNNVLHATFQNDPTTISSVRGYTGDPISGDYTAGVSYTPTRDGAACDEIDGVAGAGTFAYDWKDNDATVDDIAVRWTANSASGDPSRAVWGGTPVKVASNFFEWSRLNASTPNDATRAAILDKTLIWLIGHDHPTFDLVAPNGGEVFTGSTISISWTEAAAPGFSIASRKIYYSDNSGDRWNLITSSPGTSPYTWNISSIPNGVDYRIKMVISDNGTPALTGVDASAADFTINRSGGDTRGPVVVAGSIVVDPNPIRVPDPVNLTATVTDVTTGNSNVTAAEWSHGSTPAPAGTGTAMGGSFISPTVLVNATINSQNLNIGDEKIWVRGRDAAGNWGNATALNVIVLGGAASVDGSGSIPRVFALYSNAPNPFNPLTTIRFDMPRSAQVHLEILDVSGRRVRTLVDGTVDAGARSVVWDGRDGSGQPVGSGMYFYKLDAGDFHATRKMTLLK